MVDSLYHVHGGKYTSPMACVGIYGYIYIYGILCTEGVVCGRMQFLPLVQTKVSASGFC